jgi:hypothetical protein
MVFPAVDPEHVDLEILRYTNYDYSQGPLVGALRGMSERCNLLGCWLAFVSFRDCLGNRGARIAEPV